MPTEMSPSFKRLLKETEETPIEAIEECQSNYERADSTHNQKIRETLTLAAAIVLKLRSSPNDLAAFDKHEFWNGVRSVPGDNRLPRRVLRFVLGAKTAKGSLYEQARSYANLVSHLLDEGLSPPEILDHLSNSSVHKVMLLIPKPPRRAGESDTAPTATPAQRSVGKVQGNTEDSISCDASGGEDKKERDRSDEGPSEAESDVENDPHAGSSRRDQPQAGTSSGGGSGDTSDRRPTFNANRDVSFDADRHFDLILGLEEGDEVQVTLRREVSDKTWVKLRATNVQRMLRSRPPLR